MFTALQAEEFRDWLDVLKGMKGQLRMQLELEP